MTKLARVAVLERQARANNLECRRSHNESIYITLILLQDEMSNNTFREILSSNDEKRH